MSKNNFRKDSDTIIRKMEEAESLKKAANQSQFNKVILLTPKEVCQLLNISSRTLFSWRLNSTLAFIQIGRKILFRVDDIVACMDAHYIPLSVKKGRAV